MTFKIKQKIRLRRGDRVDEIIQKEGLPAATHKSIVEPAVYRADLDDTRRRGYAIDREEFQEGVSGVSAPIFSPIRKVVATLSIVGPEFRMTEEKFFDFGAKCVELAGRLSAGLN